MRNTHSFSAASSRRSFQTGVVEAFVRSGWLLALDAQRVLVGWGEWSESDAPSTDVESCSLYTPDFYLESSHPWRQTTYWDLLSREQFASHVLAGLSGDVNAQDQGFQWLEPSLDEFAATSWAAIQTGFREGRLEKAVPVVYARAEGTPSIAALLRRLVALPRELFIYGLWGADASGMVGATPELLFRHEDSVLETMALAGTAAKSDPEAGRRLMADPKERYEHQLVVDDLKERLGELGEVTAEPTGILELPTLLHLHTPIRARIQKGSRNFASWVHHLHPTPALGVWPRALGAAEIRRWDRDVERGRFGAPFGVAWPGGSHCVVAIRNIQWAANAVKLGSGCGVLKQSQLEREWRELGLKRESVKRMLGL